MKEILKSAWQGAAEGFTSSFSWMGHSKRSEDNLKEIIKGQQRIIDKLDE